MTRIDLPSTLEPAVRRFAHGFVSHVLDGCDPAGLVSDAVEFGEFDAPTHVLAFGKAAVKMVQACVDGLGSSFAGGVVLCPESNVPEAPSNPLLRFFGVDHPAPTARNVEATETLAQYARSIPETDHCIVCISGGGSAHLCSPKPGVTLEQIIETTNTLNANGASIHELNYARRSLETLKAGGLAETLSHVRSSRAVVLSDVLGDDLEIIASGPMMSCRYPVEHTIVGNHQTAFGAAKAYLESYNLNIHHLASDITGDSQAQARVLAERFVEEPRSACLIAGETTVDREGTTGIGGPSMEFTLSTALMLAESEATDWLVLGLATDGIDGPTDAAGAVITSGMLDSEDLIGEAQKALANHDSLGFLDSIGAAIRTGPTGTNLNDLCLVCPLGRIELG